MSTPIFVSAAVRINQPTPRAVAEAVRRGFGNSMVSSGVSPATEPACSDMLASLENGHESNNGKDMRNDPNCASKILSVAEGGVQATISLPTLCSCALKGKKHRMTCRRFCG